VSAVLDAARTAAAGAAHTATLADADAEIAKATTADSELEAEFERTHRSIERDLKRTLAGWVRPQLAQGHLERLVPRRGFRCANCHDGHDVDPVSLCYDCDKYYCRACDILTHMIHTLHNRAALLRDGPGYVNIDHRQLVTDDFKVVERTQPVAGADSVTFRSLPYTS